MLSETFINDLLRDHQAWRRAAGRQTELDCLDPSTVAAKASMGPIFRRGCADNVCTLRLLNNLRDGGRGDEFTRHWRLKVQDPWNGSKKLGEAPTDPLHALLLRQLARHGFADGYDAARANVLKQQADDIARIQRQREIQKTVQMHHIVQAQIQETVDQESRRRQTVENWERRKRENIMSSLWNTKLVALIDSEFIARHTIFQKAGAHLAEIALHEDVDLQKTLQMPAPYHRTYLHIWNQEEERRQRIVLNFKKQHKALLEQFQSDVDYMLQIEITRIAEEEKLLKQIMHLTRLRKKA